MKAIYNDKIIAESDDTVFLENNHYFPMGSINKAYFSQSNTTSKCPWKGTASYFTITVEGKINADAAWYYAIPSEKASTIANRVAFWKGVQIID
jgi:uncharacterized protein (DUF427 family)